MESTLISSSNGSDWEIIPVSALSGAILAVLFLYLFFRHMLFVLMFMDVILAFFRKFSWFPGEGNRRKTIIHWVIALGLLVGYISIAGAAGWLDFVPQ